MATLALATFLSATAIAPTGYAQTHTVQSGDTLWKISQKNNVALADIVKWNQLSSETIYPGQVLHVSTPETLHTVQAGEIMSGIAKKYDILIADIKIKNQLNSDTLKVGQVLKIPAQKGNYLTHTVKAGESLSIIARDYFVSVSDLKKWNQLSSELIQVGQVLRLTESQTLDTVTYTVKAGDFLWKIANEHGTTVQEIVSLNGLTSDMLLIGQVLKLPKGNAPKQQVNPEPTPKQETSTPNQIAKIHVVQSGEYLSVIAKKYGITIEQIKRWNGLSSDMIYAGQELKVSEGQMPKPSAPSFLANGQFPLPKGSYLPFGDTWNHSRTYGGDRGHEGTDIMAPIGTPIYSATDGVIVNYGWLELGGWRISIKSPEGYNLYYAHMSKYAPGMKTGVSVKKGQLIGYVGNTGYGKEGTSGKFDPHLHFGIYDSKWNALNPYQHLKYWESK